MSEDVIVKSTCARDCCDACGIAVYTHDGAITKVLGDPDYPVLRAFAESHTVRSTEVRGP
jgi:hypothetical protein